MRSPSDLHKALLGDPSDPNFSYRLNAYDLERMAQMHRAIVIGELVAEGILWLARLPKRLLRAARPAPTQGESLRGAGAD